MARLLGKLAHTTGCWCHDCQNYPNRTLHLISKRRWRRREKRDWQRTEPNA